MEDIGQSVDLCVTSHAFILLFTNKLIVLKRVERNKTSRFNLLDYSWERGNEGDSLSEKTLPKDDSGEDNSKTSESSNLDESDDASHILMDEQHLSIEGGSQNRNPDKSDDKEESRNNKRKLEDHPLFVLRYKEKKLATQNYCLERKGIHMINCSKNNGGKRKKVER